MNDPIRNKVTEYKRQNTPEGKTFLHRKKEYNLVNKGISLLHKHIEISGIYFVVF
jgi:hypothetical protein